jgi:tetratricopeptide (TPR) repeat protein
MTEAKAARHFQEALAAARKAGPTWIVGGSLIYLGSLAATTATTARARGDLERRQLHQEALPTVREILRWSLPHTLGQLGCAEARLGQLDQAQAHLHEAAALLLATPQPASAVSWHWPARRRLRGVPIRGAQFGVAAHDSGQSQWSEAFWGSPRGVAV